MEDFTIYKIDVFGNADDFIKYVRTKLNEKGKRENKDYYIKIKYKNENEYDNNSMVGGAANNEKGKNKQTDSTFPFSMIESALDFIDANVATLKGENVENDEYTKRIKSKKELYDKLKTKTKLEEVQEKTKEGASQGTFISRFFTRGVQEDEPAQTNETNINDYLEELFNGLKTKKTEQENDEQPIQNANQETTIEKEDKEIECIEISIKEQPPKIQKENHLRELINELV